MDLALAIARIDPKATYLLNHSQADDEQRILEWRGPGKQPTDGELSFAWALILADRADAARIEEERQLALGRVKGDPVMADIVKVLEL